MRSTERNYGTSTHPMTREEMKELPRSPAGEAQPAPQCPVCEIALVQGESEWVCALHGWFTTSMLGERPSESLRPGGRPLGRHGRQSAAGTPPCDCEPCDHGMHHDRHCQWWQAYLVGHLPNQQADVDASLSVYGVITPVWDR